MISDHICVWVCVNGETLCTHTQCPTPTKCLHPSKITGKRVCVWALFICRRLCNLTVSTWTFGAALSGWCVCVGTVEWRTRSPLTLYAAMLRRRERKAVSAALKVNSTVQCVCVCECRCAHLTCADVAGVVRGRKPLSVAIDTMVIGAAFTHCTTGAWGNKRDSEITQSPAYKQSSDTHTHSYLWSCWDAGTQWGGIVCVYTTSLH